MPFSSRTVSLNSGLFIAVVIGCLLIYPALIGIRLFADPNLGCKVVEDQAGWRSCQVISRPVVFVNLRGCGERDGHAYRVVGKNVAGDSAAAIICCGTVIKGCTIRSE